MATVGAETIAAHDDVVAIIRSIPDTALDWQPGGEEWSLKQVIGHLAGAGIFFAYILDSARATDFGPVTLSREEIIRRGAEQQVALQRCKTTNDVLENFQQGYDKTLQAIASMTLEEVDRPFQLQELRPGSEPSQVTLRSRFVDRFGAHLRDHEGQLKATIASWRAQHE